MNEPTTIKQYLNIESIQLNENKEFSINKQTKDKEFHLAIANLLNLNTRVFNKDGVILFSFNNQLVTYDFRFEEIEELYRYAVDHNMKKNQRYLGNFILAFQYSIESDVYNNSKIYDKLKLKFYSVFDRTDFYNDGKYVSDSFDYLCNFVNETNDNSDILFFLDNIPKLYQRNMNDVRYHKIFYYLLKGNKSFGSVKNFV